MEMITTGDPITAERAHHFGLVNELTEDGEAFEGALRLAERVTANAPVVRYCYYYSLSPRPPISLTIASEYSLLSSRGWRVARRR